MKPYGIPRLPELNWPDVGDIKKFGFKSAIGKFPGKGGDIRGYFRNSSSKRNTRRIWKKRERQKVKKEMQNEKQVQRDISL